MSTQNFDQDNVFDEQQTAFATDPGAATSVPSSGKTVKKGGGAIPLWLWAVIALMVLLVTFVVFRIISGRQSADSPADIAPIVQSTPQPVIAPPQPEAVQPAPQPDLSVPEGTVQPSALPMPGDDPIAPVTVAATQAVLAESVSTLQAPAAATPAPIASPTQAQSPVSADERKQFKDRIEALSGDVERLERKLKEQQSHTGAPSTTRRATASAVAPARRALSSEKQTATPPAAIVGLTLKAIVDDSAWLQTESGESVMVQPGDVIHGIGTVKAVDPDAGTVRFTDGRVLR